MINLLPPKQIEELKQRENFTIIFHLFFFFLIFLLFLYLLLLSLKIKVEGTMESQKIILEREESLLDLKTEKDIENYNKLLLKVNSFLKEKVYLSQVLEKISELIPEEISLHNLNLEYKKGEGILVSLSGNAKERKDFLDFIKILKEKYSDVYFSQESLFKEKDVEFFINFKIK